MTPVNGSAPLGHGRAGWEKYIAAMRARNVPDNALRWYVRHVERFHKIGGRGKLATRTRTDVERWLEQLGRDPAVKDWHFVQGVHALEIPGVSVRSPMDELGEAQ